MQKHLRKHNSIGQRGKNTGIFRNHTLGQIHTSRQSILKNNG